MKLRVLYGGTFDPVHDGHIAVALAAAHALDSSVALLPSADPPHRAPPGASAEQRAAMLDLAVAGYPQLNVDRRELRRAAHGRANAVDGSALPAVAGAAAGPSYTIDTLREVRAEIGPHQPLVWLLGADAFRELQAWREWRKFFALAHFVVAVRPGHALDQLDPELANATARRWSRSLETLRSAPVGLLWKLDLPARHEAASSVRERIASGLPWQDDVPSAVASYIRVHRLYPART